MGYNWGSQTLIRTCVQQTHCPEKNVYKHEATHADSKKFREHSCTYVVQIQPLAHTAEFCASPMDNSTTFSILKLGTLHGNQHFSWLVPGWFVYLLE